MRRSAPVWIVVAGALLLSAQPTGGQGVRFNFRDNVRNMSLYGFQGFLIEKTAEGLLEFEGDGRPATGEWKSQGLRIQGRLWTGRAQADSQGAYQLQSADVSGSVVARSDRPDGLLTLTAPRIRFRTRGSRFDMDAAVAIAQEGPAGSFTAKGGAGFVELFDTRPKDSPNSIRSAGLSGPVHVDVQTSRTVIESGQKVARTLLLAADAGRFAYDGTQRTLTLDGGFRIKGDDPVLAAEAEGDRAVIFLDPEGRPMRIQMTGDPGTTSYGPRRDGGS